MRYPLPWLVGVVLALSACTAAGQPITDTTVETTTTVSGDFPVEVSGMEIPERPERIVSLSATHTEILFAIGAGDQVVATDLFSNHPPEAADTEKLDAFDLNVEAVAALEPDLVVLADDPGQAVDSLEALGIPALLQPAPSDLSGAYSQIEQLGTATGHQEAASQLVSRMRSEIEEIVAEVPQPEEPVTYYHELDPTFYSVTSDTFIGQVYSLLGLTSIADQAEGAGPYPQLSAEYILEADPDFIFLADTKCCEVDTEAVAARPGWEHLTAVQEGRIVPLDDDVASRWGPRIVELLRTVAEEVEETLQP